MALMPSFFVRGKMARKPAAKDQDKFVVRLPDGMRERIKAKADRAGMSMNEAIVWCLEQHFPEPKTIEDKIDELVEAVAVLKGDDTYKGVDRLVAEVHSTLEEIYEKRLKTAHPDFAAMVKDRFLRWREQEAENWRDQHEDPFDDANWSGSLDDPFPDDPDAETKR